MKKIIEAIKALFSKKVPATYAEIKKESIEAAYKVEPAIEEEKPKKAPAKKKKKPAVKKKKDGLK